MRAAPGTDAAQAQVYLGVFSPTRGSYEVGVPGGALLSAPYSGEGFGQAAARGWTSSRATRPGCASSPSATGRSAPCGPRRRSSLPGSRPTCASRATASAGPSGTRPRSRSTKPAVVLGTAVVVLPDLAPGASATVDLRAQPDAFGRALSERIFGQQQFSSDGRPTGDFLRDQVRRQLVDALTYDPFFGSNGTLPVGRPGPPGVGPAGPLRGDRRRPGAPDRRGDALLPPARPRGVGAR